MTLVKRLVFRLAVTALSLVGSAALAAAQATLPSGAESDDGIRRQVQLALTNIQRARCAQNKPCAPASPDELASPPITIAEARGVIRRGVLSGAAEACGLDWSRQNFLPMMAYWRQQRKTDRQLALIGLLHGIAQGQANAMLASRPCTDQSRQGLQAQLSFKP